MNINNNFLILFLAIFIGVLPSCDDPLEEELLDATAPPDAYSSAEATEVALNGIIADWDGNNIFRRNLIVVTAYRCDDTHLRNDTSPSRVPFYTQELIPANDYVITIYETFYESILNANLAIEGLESVTYDINDNLRLQHIAEAKFYRAFSYYHLVRLYGDLILFTSENDLLKPDGGVRVSKNEIYTQIVSDLTAAREFLPNKAGARLPEGPYKSTASAYLASVHLTFENWNEAVAAADEVIQSGEHTLLSDFADVFKQANENSSEHIFSIRHDDASNNLAGAWYGSPNLSGGEGGVFRNPLTTDLRDLYPEGDQRINVTFLSQIWNRPGGEWVVDENGNRVLFPIDVREVSEDSLATGKWWDFAAPDAEQRWKDFAAMRYAEVLLIYAEAVNEGGARGSIDKFEAINLVRRRAGLGDLSGLDQSGFRDAVRLERRLELADEGKRMYDLLRWGELVQALQRRSDDRGLGHVIPATSVLLPIPQTEIDLNPLATQNPGY